jgi:hypothetical protein
MNTGRSSPGAYRVMVVAIRRRSCDPLGAWGAPRVRTEQYPVRTEQASENSVRVKTPGQAVSAVTGLQRPEFWAVGSRARAMTAGVAGGLQCQPPWVRPEPARTGREPSPQRADDHGANSRGVMAWTPSEATHERDVRSTCDTERPTTVTHG